MALTKKQAVDVFDQLDKNADGQCTIVEIKRGLQAFCHDFYGDKSDAYFAVSCLQDVSFPFVHLAGMRKTRLSGFQLQKQDKEMSESDKHILVNVLTTAIVKASDSMTPST